MNPTEEFNFELDFQSTEGETESRIPSEMLSSLMRPEGPKVFCNVETRNRHGHIVSRCTMHRGHVAQDGSPNAHVDTHNGARWGVK